MKHSIAFITFILCFACANAQTPRISFMADSLYPEGVAYNNNSKMFMVTSVTTGTIGNVNKNGDYTIFYKDSSLKSSFGMKPDYMHNRLWICTGDPHHSKSYLK